MTTKINDSPTIAYYDLRYLCTKVSILEVLALWKDCKDILQIRSHSGRFVLYTYYLVFTSNYLTLFPIEIIKSVRVFAFLAKNQY